MPDVKKVLQNSPPEEIIDDLMSIVNSRIKSYLVTPASKDAADQAVQFVSVGLGIHASKTLANLGTVPPFRNDLLPLEALTKIIEMEPPALEDALPTLLLDAILAYPTHASVTRQLLSNAFEDNVIMANSFKQEIIEASVRLLERENSRLLKMEKDQKITEVHLPKLVFSLFLYSRVHPTLCAYLLKARNFFDIIKVTYSTVTDLPTYALDETKKVQTKSHLLLLLHNVFESLPLSDKEWRIEMLEDPPSKDQTSTLADTGMIHDYQVIFAENSQSTKEDDRVGEKEMDALRSLSAGTRVSEHREDETAVAQPSSDVSYLLKYHDAMMLTTSVQLRIEPILVLFPDIPPDLLHQALRHPRFANIVSTSAEDQSVLLLTNALLDNTLPPDLVELARLIRPSDGTTPTEPSGQVSSTDHVGQLETDMAGGSEGNGSRQVAKSAKKGFRRENIFDEMPMDFSKLSFGKDGR